VLGVKAILCHHILYHHPNNQYKGVRGSDQSEVGTWAARSGMGLHLSMGMGPSMGVGAASIQT
jgi:hypothetical protein